MPTRYSLMDLHVDLVSRRVERAGAPLDITGLSFDLLACFLARGNAVVSFDELMAAVWAPAVVNEETVTQRVKLLRQALGDSGRNSRYIRSVRGRGYQLIAEPGSIPVGGETIVEPLVMCPRSVSASRLRRFAIPASAAGALIGAAFVAWFVARPSAPPHSEFLDRARYYASIGQKENNERAIALYQQALQQSPHLAAATLGLSFAYSARVCLYNFQAQWIDRAESLARTVLRAEPRNSLAYAALAYSEDCRGLIDAAIADYEAALRLQPTARSENLASLANLYQVKGRLVDALRCNVGLTGDAAKLRYLEIQIARTLELLGLTSAAEPRYAHSFKLNPDNVFSNIAWPRFLMNRGRLLEARAALDEALARGTDRNDLLLLAGQLALLRGDRPAALQSFERARALRPHSSLPATLTMLYGPEQPEPARLRERVAMLMQTIETGDRWPENWLEIAMLHAALGAAADSADARERGRARAIAALDRAVDAGFLDEAYLQISPLFAPLASDPGFARVVQTITHRVEEQRRAVLASGWAPHEVLMATATP